MRALWWIAVLAGCDTVQDRPEPSWSYLHAAIIAPSCATASCHSRISSVAGMDLSTAEHAYAMLTGRTCRAPSLPGEPPLSYVTRFLDVLHGIGVRPSDPNRSDLLMPPDQRLPDVEIELVERWYEAGAPCD
jgi:hypothetical protein